MNIVIENFSTRLQSSLISKFTIYTRVSIIHISFHVKSFFKLLWEFTREVVSQTQRFFLNFFISFWNDIFTKAYILKISCTTDFEFKVSTIINESLNSMIENKRKDRFLIEKKFLSTKIDKVNQGVSSTINKLGTTRAHSFERLKNYLNLHAWSTCSMRSLIILRLICDEQAL